MNKPKKFLVLLLIFVLLAGGSLVMGVNSYSSYQDNSANMEYNISESEAALIAGDREMALTQSDWAMEAAVIMNQRKTEMAIFFGLALVFAGAATWSGLRYKKA